MAEVILHDLKEKLIEAPAVPPAGHISFTKGQGATAENASVKFLPGDLDIPGAFPVNVDVGFGKEFGNGFLG